MKKSREYVISLLTLQRPGNSSRSNNHSISPLRKLGKSLPRGKKVKKSPVKKGINLQSKKTVSAIYYILYTI